jgi:hypothetical protein
MRRMPGFTAQIPVLLVSGALLLTYAALTGSL